ncbi:chemotaxis protein CheW [Parvularcula oceani]|uniref:chemotaxis protein CheW n=1 Tax=Parvularcula oceani TaxID=1247963 RepID=UPI0004E24224|nr:chemotaxis protein CheW [Parvularcula oceani]
MSNGTPAAEGADREIVAFRIADQEYGIDIMTVREIRGWTAATPLPQAPSYVRGVINLRGAVLPVVDLGTRFGMPPREESSRSVIIVVQAGTQLVGLIVDAVADILSISHDHLQPTPQVASEAAQAFVESVAAVDERMIQLIRLQEVFGHDAAQAA